MNLQKKEKNMEENKISTEENAENVTEETLEEVIASMSENSSEDSEEIAEEAEETEEKQEKSEKPAKADKKKVKKLEAELTEVKKALSEKDTALGELNETYLRLAAEYDNFRKRSAKEREGIYTDACSDVLTQILPILDTLERAAQYSTEADAETPMGKGLALTLKSFSETLAKLGVTEIEALGKTFDPNLHNAVMHVEDENVGEGEIVEVFMKGYAKGDKVLRYSMVKVAN
ncbi:MAG: nucleotide exchange factor GrpE [Clostridia bacterium]|nr:nucleotide exchange factor GrpE [Clostridia bacterium]